MAVDPQPHIDPSIDLTEDDVVTRLAVARAARATAIEAELRDLHSSLGELRSKAGGSRD